MSAPLPEELFHITPERNRFRISGVGLIPGKARGIMSRPLPELYFTTEEGIDRVIKEMLTDSWIISHRPVYYRVDVTGLPIKRSDWFDYEFTLDIPVEYDRMRFVGYITNK